MQSKNVPIWPGSSSFAPGDTPFGFYDYDSDFQIDADKVAVFCTQRLGYPLVDVELQDINFYTAFEEAVTTYGNEVYAYKIKQDYLDIEGSVTSSNLNHALIRPNMGTTVRVGQQYAVEAGVGGDIDWYSGSFAVTSSKQVYDMNAWATENGIGGGELEIMEVFYQQPPPIVRYFDPYAGTGTGVQSLMETFGWGNFTPGINFLLMPVYADLEKIQAIQFNDTIRKSNYSFNIINNQLRIFPTPNQSMIERMWFKYILKSERNNPSEPSGSNKVTNVSNVPYDNPYYNQINSIGRQWIFEYALALSKEMLGYVRGKYSTVPIPGSEVTLNQADLLSAATAEKTALIERLRTFLDELSREKGMERKATESEFRLKELNQVPYTIYIA